MGRKSSYLENANSKKSKLYSKIEHDYESNPKHRDPDAYRRFKTINTDYSSKKQCSYGDKKKLCDAGCRFWNSCKNGKLKYEWKGDVKSAWSNTENESNSEK